MKNSSFLGLILGCLIFITSCEKDEDITPNMGAYSNQIILSDLIISGDSVRLNWSKLDTLKFTGYLIVRKDDEEILIDPTNYYSNYIIARIYDPNVTSFTDKNIPLAPYLDYQVIGLLSNGYSSNYVFSNTKSYERASIKVFSFDVLDVLPDLNNNRLYIIEQEGGRISIFDFETLTVTKSITTDATIGYCSFGTYNDTKELYVPRADGWIFVYNAETLVKIDQIDVTHPSSCVLSKNGNLFISTDAWTNKPLKVFNRASKSMISENGDFEDTRLRIIPNTNTEILEVTIHIGPTDLDYYKFDSNGNFILHQNDRYHGDYPLNHDIFQFFPDGDKFITSSQGAIYDVNMTYLNRLPQGDLLFSDYAFNSNASVIYCACSNEKSIISYSNPQFDQIKKYQTKAYPFKIYKKDNVLICLSKTSVSDLYGYSPYQLVIEKINL